MNFITGFSLSGFDPSYTTHSQCDPGEVMSLCLSSPIRKIEIIIPLHEVVVRKLLNEIVHAKHVIN